MTAYTISSTACQVKPGDRISFHTFDAGFPGRVEMEVSSVEQAPNGLVHLFGRNSWGVMSDGFFLHPFAAVRKASK
jgi:hypothetical protein